MRNEVPTNIGENTCTLAKTDWIQKGDLDPLGDKVVRVLVGTDKFLIYSVAPEDRSRDDGPGGDTGGTSEGDKGLFNWTNTRSSDHVWLRTIYPKDYDCAKKLRKNLGSIAGELAFNCDVVDSICRSQTLDSHTSSSLRRRASEMMARAMVMAYEDDHLGAVKLLGHLRHNVTTMRDSRNRMRYVQGNLFALASIMLLWTALHLIPYFEPVASLVVPKDASAFQVKVLDILALGAVGAFFSVSASISSIKVHHSVTFWEMVYSGIIRIPIGVIAAGVTIFLISGGWLLASIEPSYLPWTYLLFGFLAGFSELFVPNALRQVEGATAVADPEKPTAVTV